MRSGGVSGQAQRHWRTYDRLRRAARRPFVAAATANLVPSQETNAAKAVLMHNVWANSGTQDEPNASMDRRSQFSHARRAADLGCRDYDRSDWLGYD